VQLAPLALPVLLVVATAPGVASAGVLSFISDLFAEEAAAREVALVETGVNSQNVPLLQAAKNIDPNPARGGGDIETVAGSAIIAPTGPAGVPSEIERKRSSDEISIHVVRPGETLSQIAEMYSVSANTIRWANDLGAKSVIQPEQVLVILPIDGVRHEVKKGDTIESIAKEHKGDIDEILVFNGLERGAQLTVGETITIPGGEIVAPAPTRTASKSGGSSAVASVSTVSGYFIHPLPGGVKTQGVHGYNGIDVGAPVGTPIRAAASGQVIVSRSGGWNGGYGNYVVIRHPNGTQTLYAHMSSNAVFSGNVSQGQIVGYVGNTGRSTGPHLHFEVRGARNPF
jgi:LysM repeat protein